MFFFILLIPILFHKGFPEASHGSTGTLVGYQSRIQGNVKGCCLTLHSNLGRIRLKILVRLLFVKKSTVGGN